MTKLRVLLVIGLALGVSLVLAAGMFARRPTDLRVTLQVEKADLGIPGITKTYNVSLRNHGRPAFVTRCDYVDDTMSSGASVAYSIQRLDPPSGQWRDVLQASPENFCHPYPLGIVKADLKRRLLFSGQALEIGEEATAARDGFNLGDKARFVVFTQQPGDYRYSIATEPFTIDERPSSDVQFRVRH